MSFPPKDQLLLVYLKGHINGKNFCAGMTLKHIQGEDYRIMQIAPILDNHFWKNIPITLVNIEAKCKNNEWTFEFSPLRTPV